MLQSLRRALRVGAIVFGFAFLAPSTWARAEFQVERVRGVYTLRSSTRNSAKSVRGVQRSSGQRKLAWGTEIRLEQADFSEASAQLVGYGMEVSLLGGSGLRAERSGPTLIRTSGALRVKSSKNAPVRIQLGTRGQWARLFVSQKSKSSGPVDWIVFERAAEPQAQPGARDPELIVVVLRGELELTRPERGAASKGVEKLALHAGDEYVHSGYSGGDYAPHRLPEGEIAAFYRQWGWEP